jgi:hypothetical protein
MEQIFNKYRLFAFIFICFLFSLCKAQERKIDSLEFKAVQYFCNNWDKFEIDISKIYVVFNGYSSGYPSNIYDIAQCEKDINFLKNFIPNKAELDSLDKKYQSQSYKYSVIKYHCNFLNRGGILKHFSKDTYRLFVKEHIEYKGFYFVELYLANKRNETVIIGIKFDKNGVIVSHCINSIVS